MTENETDKLPEPPAMDGKLFLMYRTPEGDIVTKTCLFGDKYFVSYTEQSFGLELRFKTYARVFPWHTVVGYEIYYNTDKFFELLDQWAELTHPNHLELNPHCPMCAETVRANTSMVMYRMGGGL